MKQVTLSRAKQVLLFGVILSSSASISLSSAQAYGLEGMFGGRPNPDNTIIIDNPVQAQARPLRAQSVLQHPRPEYDPTPLSTGSFYIFPSVEMGANYNSNIYATQSGQVSDGIFNARPSISVLSNWNRHALAMTAAADINLFMNRTREDYSNAIAEVQGRYDIVNQTWIALHGGYQNLSEPRTSPNNVGGSLEPTTFNAFRTGVTFFRGVGQLQPLLDYDLKRLDYNNTPAAGGTTINQMFRNRTQHTFGAKTSYVVTDNFRPYIKGQYNIREYDNDTQSRRSSGYRADVGALWDLGGITSLDIYAGWLSQDYDRFAANRVNDGIDFGGRFTWNVTGLTTLVLEANRSIEETTIAAFNSYQATGGSATVTHELRRNLLLEGDVAFTRDDFQGTGTRQDDITSAGAGARWLINRNLYTDVGYNWNHRVSSQAGQSYVTHLVTLRLGVQY